jgi:hypothetical protein
MPPEDNPTSQPQESTAETAQPSVDSSSPSVDAPSEATLPQTNQGTSEAPTAPTETVPTSETAQMGRNEPLPPKSEPIHSTQDKPIAPEPPSAVASTPAPSHSIRDLLNKARVAIQDRKRKKRDRIMQALNSKHKITNDEVEKLLHISDASATRYLSALEKEGKIKQVGRTGAGVAYTKV